MSGFYAFASAHPILTWLLAWGVWPVCWMVSSVLTSPFSYAFKAWNRHCRTKNISSRGWPENPLMDADGDIVHPKSEDQ